MKRELIIEPVAPSRGFGGDFQLRRIVITSDDNIISINCFGKGAKSDKNPKIVLRCSKEQTDRLLKLLYLVSNGKKMPIDERIAKAAKRIAEKVIASKLREISPDEIPEIEITAEDISIGDAEIESLLSGFPPDTL